jgi:hypothetical protein
MRRPNAVSRPAGPKRRATELCLAAGALFLACAALVSGQLPSGAEHEAIAYSTTAPTDAVARLQQRIDRGEVRLDFDAQRGYLPSVLKHLDIPLSSQGLVFSRTSLQVDRIAPWTPRAIYFNDDVYVGWVQQGPIMEFASVDPKLGGVFYTLDQERRDHPVFRRETGMCLQCHDSSSATGGVPGFIMRSVVPDRYGYALDVRRLTTDQTPIEDRWGGWYVTGSSGSQRHMGNVIAPVLTHEVGNARSYLARFDPHSSAEVTTLDGRVDTDPYLTPHSDIVALMVLAHQTSVHNLMTFASYEGRRALYDEALQLKASGGAEGTRLETTNVRIRTAAEQLVKAMLFAKEAPLTGKIAGTSGFAKAFTARGPRDSRGRSLRDLDLERRVFRYPLSFLIYSDAFDALPPVIKDQVYRRFRQVLSGEDTSPTFAHLSAEDRQAIREILEETKPEFATTMR